MRETYADNLRIETTTANSRNREGHRLDWRKRMSDTVAYGLLVYTALQIFVTLRTLEGEGSSLLPMIALVVLVAGVIPMFRHFERRWEVLDNISAAEPTLQSAFRRDQLAIWAISIGLPFLLTALFRALAAIA